MIKASRRFNWISSSNPDNQKSLQILNSQMIEYYSNTQSRKVYQKMIDNNNDDFINPAITTISFIKYIKTLPISIILEVGCGNGRIYPILQKALDNLEYTGIEVSKEIIETNKINYPSAKWIVSDAYTIPQHSDSVDLCFSFYVLEHLVFPEKAILEMLRVIKKGGYLILIFPDFCVSGRFSSQRIGFSDTDTALHKLKGGKILDAIISLYDSRIRLPLALKSVHKKIGRFPVNANPKCLYIEDSKIGPDVDAIYISSKNEIKNWAIKQGYRVFFPAGDKAHFSEHAFLSIQKL